ncbi:extracellular solute-binding protein [Paenibacillus sp. NFR01]|uniref:extracellular solute-binding protein n=1 Tax=Paenibacillus sp. NFR01 TaxID=1566279 RepID=UPI0008CA21B3|nr:extracellular solute-binding protein [Paenibacillus sp. NFR01]SEU23633.1 carbohydrate ABC transporter substrate-binding protein, CUT1 family (TC 3.A.1.1.-) [Paenibacillus sp. NFR01]
MKRQITLATLSLVLMAGLAACGNDNNANNNGGNAASASNAPQETAAAGNETASNNATDTTGETASSMPEKPKSLTIWPDADEAKLAVITEMTKKYTEQTGIEVIINPLAMNDQPESLSLDGPAGKGPDLFYQPGIGNLVVKGLVQPLKADDSVLGIYTPESLTALSQDGTLYGLPLVTETIAMFYNKKIVPEAPKTIADLEKLAAEKTNAKKQEYGFLFEGTNFYYAWPFMGGSGGYIFKNDGSGKYDIHDIGLNKEGSVKGVQLIQDWFTKGYLPKGVNGDIVGGLFGQGKVGAIINGPWAVADLKKQLGDDLAVAPLPVLADGSHPTTFIGVKGWMLSKFSKSPQWASDLAAFLTNEENALTYFQKTGEVPPVLSVLDNPALTGDPIVAGFSEQNKYGKPFPTVPELDAVWDPMANALKFAAEGQNVQAALDDAVKQVEDKIKMSGAK